MSNLINNKKDGFVLLYAVLVTTVIVAVGLVMSNIITKQITLSIIGKDSQIAFYAADAGFECLFYWDKLGLFQVIDYPFGCTEDEPNQFNSSTKDYKLYFDNGSCAHVVVKNSNNGGVDISSTGYNVSDESEGQCPAANNLRVVYRVRGIISSE